MSLLNPETMEMLVEVIGAIFGYIGIVIMVIWWAKSLYLLVYRWLIDHKIPMGKIRIKLGHYLVLALEFLVAKDILESIVNPSYQWLITLWAIVTIRTVLSYFTNKEIAEVKEEMKADEEAVEAEEKRMEEKYRRIYPRDRRLRECRTGWSPWRIHCRGTARHRCGSPQATRLRCSESRWVPHGIHRGISCRMPLPRGPKETRRRCSRSESRCSRPTWSCSDRWRCMRRPVCSDPCCDRTTTARCP